MAPVAAAPRFARSAPPTRRRPLVAAGAAALLGLLSACDGGVDPGAMGDASIDGAIAHTDGAPVDRGVTDAGGGGVDSFVAGALTITSALTLDRTDVARGSTVGGRVTYTNLGASPVALMTATIAGRPPGGTHGGGPFDDFAPAAAATMIAPGASLTVDATRMIAVGDPLGTWESYSTWQDGGGGWHDGPSLFFTVSAPTVDGGASPDALPSTGNLPPRVVGGYFTTWENRNGVTLKSVVDQTNYNLLYVAFATGVNAGSGSLQLSLPAGVASAADMKSQIAYANGKGKKVLVSVGGYFDLGGSNSGYLLDSSAKVDEFMASMRDFHDSWGFNGMDWDLEHGNRSDVAGIVDASKRMRAEFGATWIINSAPGIGLDTWTGPNGVLDQLGPNGWDAVGEQVYDLGLSQADYQAKIVDRMTVLAKKYGAGKVILGNKYRQDSPNSPYQPSSYVDLATTQQAFAQLRGSGINIRGAFVWTIQSDSDQAFDWSKTVGGDILSH